MVEGNSMVMEVKSRIPEDWMWERLILLTRSGSYAYGTNVEESDQDYKGICIPTREHYYGLDKFELYTYGDRRRKNTRDDVDITIYSVSRFIHEALKGNVSIIELLFMGDNYLVLTELGKMLVDNRTEFLSKRLFSRFGGYARSQMQSVLRAKHVLGDVGVQCGVALKGAMHTVRLLTSIIEILETGDFSVYRPNRDLLLDIRRGRYTYDEIIEMVDEYEDKLSKVMESTLLPDEPDRDKINNLLINIVEKGLSYRS